MQFSDVKDFPVIPQIGGRKVEDAQMSELADKGATLVTYGVNDGDTIIFPNTKEQIVIKKRQIRPGSDSFEYLLQVIRNGKGSWLSVGCLGRRDNKFAPIHEVAKSLTDCANDEERVYAMVNKTIVGKGKVTYTRNKFENGMRTDTVESVETTNLVYA
jgi:hypothetical protein